jgi:hypothetical protein
LGLDYPSCDIMSQSIGRIFEERSRPAVFTIGVDPPSSDHQDAPSPSANVIPFYIMSKRNTQAIICSLFPQGLAPTVAAMLADLIALYRQIATETNCRQRRPLCLTKLLAPECIDDVVGCIF